MTLFELSIAICAVFLIIFLSSNWHNNNLLKVIYVIFYSQFNINNDFSINLLAFYHEWHFDWLH